VIVRSVRCCLAAPARLLLSTVLLLTTGTAVAFAQPEQPISIFVVDARGVVPFLPDTEGFAAPRETTPEAMPSYGWGVDVGAHVYPFRWKIVAFGVGASYHVSRGGRTPDTPEGSSTPAGPTVESRFKAFSPQVSLNFGHRMGWSYLSAGLGRSTFRAWRSDAAEETGEGTKTINYGGGARWFINQHVAFSLDLRFYAINPVAASTGTYGHPRITFAAVAGGISVR
jgi:hypothetical protein